MAKIPLAPHRKKLFNVASNVGERSTETNLHRFPALDSRASLKRRSFKMTKIRQLAKALVKKFLSAHFSSVFNQIIAQQVGKQWSEYNDLSWQIKSIYSNYNNSNLYPFKKLLRYIR